MLRALSVARAPLVRRAALATSVPTVRIDLQSGHSFSGTSFGAPKSVAGELVFSTGMVGYPEAMSDPSYRGQILVFTQPLIGNYGVPPSSTDKYGLQEFLESPGIQAAGIIVSDYAAQYSHWNAAESLASWCKRFDVPAVTGVDTRALTKLLRSQGSTLGRLVVGGSEVPFENPNERNLVADVSTKEVKVYNPNGDVTIALVDCGVKHNIIRCLADRGAKVVVVPWDYDVSQVAYDGLLLSNGPGDPARCGPTVDIIRKALGRREPIFGICMGNLLLGLAAGGKSYKLRFGNRGHNQPALNTVTNTGVITSQNHGYAIDVATLGEGWLPYFVNINDGSNEGLRHASKPFTSVQFHPEYRGGPEDTAVLFDSFMKSVRAGKLEAADDVIAATA